MNTNSPTIWCTTFAAKLGPNLLASPDYKFATRGFRATPVSSNLGFSILAANEYIRQAVQQPGLFEINLFGKSRTRGDFTPGSGSMVLHNADGSLDALPLLRDFDMGWYQLLT